MNRRNFLKQSSLLTAGSVILPTTMSFMSKKTKTIGLQIYTVREELKNNLKGTLKAISKIGYQWIELAGYKDGKFYDMQPSEIKKMISDLGMEIISSHCGVTLENASEVAEAHAAVGASYCIKPWLPEENRKTKDDYLKVAEELNKVGEIMKAKNIRYGYHNHAFEFDIIEEAIPYELLLENTDKELVTYEADLYWFTKAGHKPTDIFAKYPGRFELFHVKDMDNTEEKYFTEVGNGIIDFKEIFAAKEQAGMKYFFVEQDKCKNNKPLDAVRISFDYLNKADFI